MEAEEQESAPGSAGRAVSIPIPHQVQKQLLIYCTVRCMSLKKSQYFSCCVMTVFDFTRSGAIEYHRVRIAVWRRSRAGFRPRSMRRGRGFLFRVVSKSRPPKFRREAGLPLIRKSAPKYAAIVRLFVLLLTLAVRSKSKASMSVSRELNIICSLC